MSCKKLVGCFLIFTTVFIVGAITAAYNKWLTDIFIIQVINDTSKAITNVSLTCKADVQTQIDIPIIELRPHKDFNLEIVSHGSAISCKATVILDDKKVLERTGGAIPPLSSKWIPLHFTE